jgi:hypothetical protein
MSGPWPFGGEEASLPLGEVQASLHSMQSDVLEQWRTAVLDNDARRIGELVQFARSLSGMGHALNIGESDAEGDGEINR